jgi:DNA polymerase (family 10)
VNNKTLLKQLRLTLTLLELHEENAFKIRAYQSAIFAIEQAAEPLHTMSAEALATLTGKSISAKIQHLLQHGSLPDLDELLAKTPAGVIGMMKIKGLGPKKINALWREYQITSTEQLLEACQKNELSKFKGFGQKTQEAILQAILFDLGNRGKMLYAEAFPLAEWLKKWLSERAETQEISHVGQIRRCSEIISDVAVLVATENMLALQKALNECDTLNADALKSGVFVWRGHSPDYNDIAVSVHFCTPAAFAAQLVLLTGTAQHLAKPLPSNAAQTFMQWLRKQPAETNEAAYYEKAQLPYLPAEMREGHKEWDWAATHQVSELIEFQQLKGVLHNHSTYSDGQHTLAEMASHAKSLGYEYLGISDHSKTASYANGLSEERVFQQQTEIDALNQTLAPFKIFKGIESDILGDGSLDYAPDILATFDFVVASVHSGLSMDEPKATARLLKAIENPFTTMLGHPSGRLLLRREGYPIDYQKIIDACAANGVIIELNANPWRLDIDWRWLDYIMQKGVLVSINPDAHEKDGYQDMHYGVLVARKGGLTTDFTFNALSLNEVAAHFRKKLGK